MKENKQDKFSDFELQFLNFYLKRIKQTFDKEKEWFSTKYDVRDNFNLNEKKFRNICLDLDKKINSLSDKEFEQILITNKINKEDLSIFLKSAT